MEGLDISGVWRRPTRRGEHAVCDCCQRTVVAKESQTHRLFWSHLPGSFCAYVREPETPWHHMIKAYFPIGRQEYRIEGSDGFWRRADVMTISGIPVEAQSSYISKREILARELAYEKKVIWIVHCRYRAFKGLSFEKLIIKPRDLNASVPDASVQNWRPRERFVEKWSNAQHVFFDPDTGILWELTGGKNEYPFMIGEQQTSLDCVNTVKPIRRDFFLSGLEKGEPLDEILQEGHKIANLEPLDKIQWIPFGPFDGTPFTREEFETFTLARLRRKLIDSRLESDEAPSV